MSDLTDNNKNRSLRFRNRFGRSVQPGRNLISGVANTILRWIRSSLRKTLALGFSIARAVVPLRFRPLFAPIRRWVDSWRFALDTLGNLERIAPGLGPDIMCFAVIDWDFRFQRPQQLLTRFALNGHRIFYISTQFMGLSSVRCMVRTIADRIYEVRLPGKIDTVIYAEKMPVTTLQAALAALEGFMQQQDVFESVLIAHHPFWHTLLSALKEKYGWKVVYDCIDLHSGFDGQRGPVVEDNERLMVKGSDLVVASSRALYEKLSQVCTNCVLIPNACDYDHFSASFPPERTPLYGLPRPVIGYYGAIAEWFDSAAVSAASDHHPEWSFVLIGHTLGSDLADLRRRRNVHFLGEKPYSELPGYVSSFDVCVIPFRRTPLTEATNPVKLFEYLSVAKPVVATALPELEHLGDLVWLYRTPEEFVAKLEIAVGQDNPSLAEKRRAFARENTWDKSQVALSGSIFSLYGKASIIIVTLNALKHTRACIDSILSHTNYPNFDVIIVDNGSDNMVKEYLRGLAESDSRIRIIFNEANLGFPVATNIGIRQAMGSDYLVLLNNDTVVPTGWLSRLLRYARRPEVGLVGPCTNWLVNEAGVKANYHTLPQMLEFARSRSTEYAGRHFDIRCLAMFCVALRRRVYEEVGPLDEQFGIGMFEDDDYSHRVRRAGYRVICADDVFVHHHGMASFGGLKGTEYEKIFQRNKKLYEEKWGVSWKPHQLRRLS